MNITEAQVKQIVRPGGKTVEVAGFVQYFNKYADKYGVNTYLRVCHFIAQCAEESDHFNTMTEYASGKAYEGRHDLGNVHPGDGVKYKGRGFIMITGRANYEKYGTILGIDLVNHPEKALEYEVAILIAFEYWKSRNLNHLADNDDVVGVTRGVNGGTNGLETRKLFLSRGKVQFKGVVFTTTAQPTVPVNVPPPVVVPSVPTAPQKPKVVNQAAGAAAAAGAGALALVNFSNPWIYVIGGVVVLALVVFVLRDKIFKKKG